MPDDAEEPSAHGGRDLDAEGGASTSARREEDGPAERDASDHSDGTGTSADPAGLHAADPSSGSDADTAPDDDADDDPALAPAASRADDDAVDVSGHDDLDDDEVDRRFRQILGQLGDDPEDTYRASALGTAPVERPAAPPRSSNPSAAARAAHPSFTPRELGPRDHVVDEHPEDPSWGVDGFVEPDPPGPDLSDPGLMLGWLFAVGPVALGIVLGVLGRSLTVPWMLLGLAVTITGVVLLVRRMSNESPGGDGGAVV
ncbi:hypothetical protein CZ771_10505 [Actinomycetales bacterium JB111]|nr:hypothetical protein CZ771_10505 [Actinomycetales bacterium JB111]